MENNKNFKKGIQDIKNISLSLKEKESILKHLHMHMEQNPLPTRRVTSPWYSSITVFSQYRSVYMTVLCITLVVIGGNISYAAEHALPGDLLYPVKIRINERALDIVSFTPQAKIKREEVKVEKRLQEAEKLVEKGSFSAAKRIQIEQEVKKNIKAIYQRNPKKVGERTIKKDVKEVVQVIATTTKPENIFDRDDRNNRDTRNNRDNTDDEDRNNNDNRDNNDDSDTFTKKVNTHLDRIEKINQFIEEKKEVKEQEQQVRKFEDTIKSQLFR